MDALFCRSAARAAATFAASICFHAPASSVIDTVVAQLVTAGTGAEQVAILTPHTLERSSIGAATEIAGKPIATPMDANAGAIGS